MRTYLLFVSFSLFILSCTSTGPGFKRKGYRKSVTIATFREMANEFDDVYLVVKSNGYFKFYKKSWLLFGLKYNTFIGRFDQFGDTLQLHWGNDPTAYYTRMSDRLLADSSRHQLWVLDINTGAKEWSLGRVRAR
jgi:hypothetical protein